MLTFAQVKDQLLGLAWGVGIAVVVAISTAVAQAEPEEIFRAAFWTATGAVVVRSIGTAILTVLGIRLPGISGGKEA